MACQVNITHKEVKGDIELYTVISYDNFNESVGLESKIAFIHSTDGFDHPDPLIFFCQKALCFDVMQKIVEYVKAQRQ
jgi:hypothetical protein